MGRERKGRKEGRRKGRRQLFATTALLYGIEGYELRALSLSLCVCQRTLRLKLWVEIEVVSI